MTSVGARPNNSPTRSPLSGADGQDGRGGFAEAVPQGFQRLAWAAVAVVFALIVLGGIVRVSDSGLGCGPAGSGTHGWPLCNGRLVPGLDINHVLEYSHRVVAGTSGLIVFALVMWAWRRLRANKTLTRLSGAAAVLVLFEGLLGAATVEYDLHEALVAIHLGIAMIIFGLLVANARAASGRVTTGEWPNGVKRLAIGAAASVWATIVAGGLMSGTQYYGSSKEFTVGGARLACGREFPLCNGDLFPIGQAKLIDIHLIHRAFMYLTAVLVVMLAVKLVRGAREHGAEIAKPAYLMLGVLVAQIALGVLNVLLTKNGALIIGHLTVGTLLWLVTIWLTISVTGRPRRAAAGPPATSHP